MNDQPTASAAVSPKTVAIIGGGIAGLGVARALANDGFSVTIFERREKIGIETSDNSLRIIHGGFRYLQQAAILRIIDSVRDQNFCLAKYPEIIRPLASVMPLARFGLKSKLPVSMAAFVYGLFLKFLGSPLKAPKILSEQEANTVFPWASGAFKHGALQWHDAQLVSHPMLVQKICDELREQHVQLEVRTAIQTVSQNEASSGSGILLQLDSGAKRHFDFAVEALGHNANVFGERFDCGFAVAFNLVFEKTFALDQALGFSGKGGRLFFLVPRNDENEIALGTEYVSYQGTATATDKQAQDFFTAAKEALPTLPLNFANLVRIECGVVPTESDNSLKLTGRTEIKRTGNLISLLPSKYTTFKSVGERVSLVCQQDNAK